MPIPRVTCSADAETNGGKRYQTLMILMCLLQVWAGAAVQLQAGPVAVGGCLGVVVGEARHPGRKPRAPGGCGQAVQVDRILLRSQNMGGIREATKRQDVCEQEADAYMMQEPWADAEDKVDFETLHNYD